MTKAGSLILISIFLLFSCEVSHNKVEISVINDILPQLITDFSDMVPLRDDNGARTLFINDTLLSPGNNSSLGSRFKGLMNDVNIKKLTALDDDWYDLVSSMMTTQVNSRKIDPTQIRPFNGLKIEAPQSVSIDDPNRILGIMTFSLVKFDQCLDRACLLYIFACSPECNVGYLLLVERVNQKWQITQDHQFWVA